MNHFFQTCHKFTTFFHRCCISKECFEDLNSTIMGFEWIAKDRLRRYPGTAVIASIMNSDVIENFFSSQRARCNGANTNPTILAYGKAVNTIIMTTDCKKSSKRNCSKTEHGIGGAHPYNILAKKSFRSKNLA